MAQNDLKDPAKPQLVAAPRRLGKYELIARIGEGGMAEVYLARQTGPLGFQKVVVVKTIHPHLAQEQEFIDMLLDEARVSALIKHARVVDIYDLGVEDGTYFIAMEYIQGQPLSRVLGVAAKMRKKLDLYSTAQVIADAADGLHAAHNLESISGQKLELVHRDVSPGNIMIQYTGNIKILDFGVSKSLGRISSTGSGQLKGKLGYASPEQLEDEPLDRRSDVWALGVVLWEALAFRRLYRKTSPAATIKKILEGNTPPPSKYRDEIPQELDEICLKAMSIAREDRYQTAKEMRLAILAFLRSANYYGERERISTFMRLLFADRKREEETLLRKVARARSEIPVPLPVDEELSGEASTPAPPALVEKQHSHPLPDIEIVVGLQPDDSDGAPQDGQVESVPPQVRDERQPSTTAQGIQPEQTAEIWLDRVPRRWRWGAVAGAAALVLLLVASLSGGGKRQDTKTSGATTTKVATDAARSPTAPSEDGLVTEVVPNLDAAAAPPQVETTETDASIEAAVGDAGSAVASAPIDAGAETGDSPDAGALSEAEARRRAKRLYEAGTKAFVSGDLARAKSRFKKANEEREYAPALRGLGLVYERQGRARSARHYFRKYLRAAPDAPDSSAIRERIKRLEDSD